jgi:hypothetical protein
MSEHTQTPWFVGTQNDKLFIINKPPRPSHDDMADIPDVAVIAPLNACNDEANAAFIVRAVNNHEALVGALKFILAFYEPGQRHLDTEAWKVAEAGARCALKNATASSSEVS